MCEDGQDAQGGSSSGHALNAEVKLAIVEYVWTWLWRFLGLVVLIVGVFSGTAFYCAQSAINAKIDAFKTAGAKQIASSLAGDGDFIKDVGKHVTGATIRFGRVSGDTGHPLEGGAQPRGWSSCRKGNETGAYIIKFEPRMPRKPVVIVCNLGSGCHNDLSVENADEGEATVYVRYKDAPVDGHFSFVALCE